MKRPIFRELKWDDSPTPLKLGTIFLWRGKMWRRGHARIYSARPADPTIERGYRQRERRRRLKAANA